MEVDLDERPPSVYYPDTNKEIYFFLFFISLYNLQTRHKILQKESGIMKQTVAPVANKSGYVIVVFLVVIFIAFKHIIFTTFKSQL